MEYITWVEQVATALVGAVRDDDSAVVELDQLARELDLGRNELTDECLRDALRDLAELGLVDPSRSTIGPDGGRWRLTQRGFVLRDASLRTAWPSVFEVNLTPGQLEYLRVACSLSEETFESMARVNEIAGSAVANELGQDWDDADVLVRSYETAAALAALGMLEHQPAMGGYLRLFPTYRGIVRATQQETTEDRELLRALIEEGETANVDFKRELDLGKPSGKAELVRDVLGSANAQLSGRRFLVVGLDDDGAEFADVGDEVSLERLEQIVQAWAPPAPPIRMRRVDWVRHELAVIEVGREPDRLPYVAAKSHGGLVKGVVYSRHGTHTEPATPDEEAAIRLEGDRARARNEEY